MTREKLKPFAILALVMLAGCSDDPNSPLSNYGIWTDPFNGCQYVTFESLYAGSITPRLNPDGTQVCTPPRPEAEP